MTNHFAAFNAEEEISSNASNFVREGVAKDKWRANYLNTHLNPADKLTKSLPGGEKRTLFTSDVLHYIDSVSHKKRFDSMLD